MSNGTYIQAPRISNYARKFFGLGNKYKAGRRVDTLRVGALVRTTPGGRHGIFETSKGLVRKPI